MYRMRWRILYEVIFLHPMLLSSWIILISVLRKMYIKYILFLPFLCFDSSHVLVIEHVDFFTLQIPPIHFLHRLSFKSNLMAVTHDLMAYHENHFKHKCNVKWHGYKTVIVMPLNCFPLLFAIFYQHYFCFLPSYSIKHHRIPTRNQIYSIPFSLSNNFSKSGGSIPQCEEALWHWFTNHILPWLQLPVWLVGFRVGRGCG